MTNWILQLDQAASLAVEKLDLGNPTGQSSPSSQPSLKADGSWVTEIDKRVQEIVVERLLKAYPKAGVIAEEMGQDGGKLQDLTFVIDPIDGTTNFSVGHPLFCIAISVIESGETVASHVTVPTLSTKYAAEKGKGATLERPNRSKVTLRCSSRRDLSDCVFATGFATHEPKRLPEQVDRLQRFLSQTRGFRRSGSAVYDLCLVAQGVLDFYFESGLKIWDVSAGSLLVSEAGGMVEVYDPLSLTGRNDRKPKSIFEDNSRYNLSVIASQPLVFDRVSSELLTP